MKKIPIILAIFSFSYYLKAQNVESNKKISKICDKIEFIDSQQFNDNKQGYCIIDTAIIIKKINGEIKVHGKDSTFIFKDDTNDDEFIEYTFAGQDTTKKWVLILGQDYNQDYFYLINQNTDNIDTLVGYPRIFGDIYLCEEGSYTDGTAFIEIWSIRYNKFQLLEKFSLKPCDIYDNDESYLKNDYLYIRYENKKYLKVKL
jgi:hypothetical protein